MRGVNEEGEEFELRLGMCDLDVARGGLMVGPPAGSMSCEHQIVTLTYFFAHS